MQQSGLSELIGARQLASESQRRAIEADLGPLLVLAGPGAGKTFCLIERIRFLIEEKAFNPAEILAFTFTNRAAEEIASRLKDLGPRADGVKRGTIHAFCAGILREFGDQVGLERRFGIADEGYQLEILRRLHVHPRHQKKYLGLFSNYRFSGEELYPETRAVFEEYERLLAGRNVVDFDMLLLKAAELMESTDAAATVRARSSALLVDEFQDLNSAQYRVVRQLAREHKNVLRRRRSRTVDLRVDWSKARNPQGVHGRFQYHAGEHGSTTGEPQVPARGVRASAHPAFQQSHTLRRLRSGNRKSGFGFPVETRGFVDDIAERCVDS
jgi:hypothetical protein